MTEVKDISLLSIQKLFLSDIKYTVECPNSKLDCLLFALTLVPGWGQGQIVNI